MKVSNPSKVEFGNARYAAIYHNRWGAGTCLHSVHRFKFMAAAAVRSYRGARVVPIGEVEVTTNPVEYGAIVMIDGRGYHV